MPTYVILNGASAPSYPTLQQPPLVLHSMDTQTTLGTSWSLARQPSCQELQNHLLEGILCMRAGGGQGAHVGASKQESAPDVSKPQAAACLQAMCSALTCLDPIRSARGVAQTKSRCTADPASTCSACIHACSLLSTLHALSSPAALLVIRAVVGGAAVSLGELPPGTHLLLEVPHRAHAHLRHPSTTSALHVAPSLCFVVEARMSARSSGHMLT